MKLLFSKTSPYARKVRVAAAEKGLSDRIEFEPCNPFDDGPELSAANPLGKVPCLLLDAGPALFDSPVICEYLDSLEPENRLIPKDGPERWAVLRWAALGDGILDAAYNAVMESRRPDGERSDSAARRWTGSIERSLDALEGEIETLPAGVSLAHIAIGCALGYLDFRLPHLNRGDARPKLAAWWQSFQEHPAMAESVPHD